MRHRVLLLVLAVLLSLTRPVAAQIYTADGEWLDGITNIKISGFYGVTLANEGTTGTTAGLLACFSGGTAITCGANEYSLDVLGPVQSGGGTTGLATIATHGSGSCTFDGPVTSGHYVQPSLTVSGQCHDAGVLYPTSGGRILGIVTTSSGTGGTYGVFLYGRGIRASAPGVATIAGTALADVTHAQSSTTLADVTWLSFTACSAATEIWLVDVSLILAPQTSGATAGWKWGWTVPTGATMVWGTQSADPTLDYWGSVAPGGTPLTARTESDTLSTASANAVHVLAFKALVFCSSTIGTVQLTFAQNTSNASDNTIKRGSMLIARQVIN